MRFKRLIHCQQQMNLILHENGSLLVQFNYLTTRFHWHHFNVPFLALNLTTVRFNVIIRFSGNLYVIKLTESEFSRLFNSTLASFNFKVIDTPFILVEGFNPAKYNAIIY